MPAANKKNNHNATGSEAVDPEFISTTDTPVDDVCIIPGESGWRPIDADHIDNIVAACIGGQYMKNVIQRPKAHADKKGSDGKILLIEGLHFFVALERLKTIYAKLEGGDEETAAKYPDAQFTPKLVMIFMHNGLGPHMCVCV